MFFEMKGERSTGQTDDWQHDQIATLDTLFEAGCKPRGYQQARRANRIPRNRLQLYRAWEEAQGKACHD